MEKYQYQILFGVLLKSPSPCWKGHLSQHETVGLLRPYVPMEILVAVLSGISFLLLICNVLGNILVVVVIYRNRKLHNANNLLLSNLAWSDLCFAIIVFINMTLISYTLEQYLLNDFMLHALVSIYTLVAVAVERYFAIMKPFVHMRRAVKSLVYKIMTGIWILAGVLTAPGYFIPNTVHRNKENFTINATRVAPAWIETVSTIYSFVLFLFGLILPSTVIICCYSRFTYHVWFNAEENRTTNTALLKSRRKLTNLFILVTVIFLVTWSPTFGKPIVTQYIMDVKDVRKFDLAVMLLGLVGSTANPVIYSFRCPKFRQEVNKLLTCCFCNRRRRRPSASIFFVTNSYSVTRTERREAATVEPVLIAIRN